MIPSRSMDHIPTIISILLTIRSLLDNVIDTLLEVEKEQCRHARNAQPRDCSSAYFHVPLARNYQPRDCSRAYFHVPLYDTNCSTARLHRSSHCNKGSSSHRPNRSRSVRHASSPRAHAPAGIPRSC